MTRGAAEQTFDKLKAANSDPQLILINRHGRSEHWYEYLNNLDPSVTTILRAGWPKPALMYWGINTVSQWASENAAQVYAMAKESPEAAAAFMKQVPWSRRDKGGNVGSQVHAAYEDGLESSALSDELKPFLEGLHGWFKETGTEVISKEYCVWGDAAAGGYGGKVDILARHPQLGVGVLDIKTAEKGPYEDDHCQVAAYAEAEAGHPEQPVWGGLLHCRPEGTTLHLVDVPSSMEAFGAAYTVARYRGALKTPERGKT